MITESVIKDKKLHKTLGPISGNLISALIRNKQNVFTINDAVEILKLSKKQIRDLLSRLTKKGWLVRIQKDRYLLIPMNIESDQAYTEHSFIIASKVIQPYYIGYWGMLNYYGYTEQLSNTVFIATPKRKKEVEISGVRYKFINIPQYKMFGIKEIKISESSIKVSDKEKTLIDCLDHPEYCGGIVEITKGLWNAKDEIDYNKIYQYSLDIKNTAVIKRLGYIFEVLKLTDRLNMSELKNKIARGFSLLDTLLPRKGNYITRWNLLANVSRDDLLSCKGV